MDNTYKISMFHQLNDKCRALFLAHQRTKLEQAKIDDLSNLISDFYQKVYNNPEFGIDNTHFFFDFIDYGYLEDYGYYIVRNANQNYYTVTCYGEDINHIFIDVVNNIINSKAYNELYKHRKQIKKNVYYRFRSSENYERIFSAEYALDKWSKYFDGDIPEEIAASYENILNSEYNSEARVIIKNQKRK